MSDLINIHHIGGRDGSFPFPINERFASDLVVHLYDGDDGCVEQMKTAKMSGVTTRAHSRLFAGRTGEATLNIGYDPYWSSLLTFDPAFAGATRYATPQDYTYGDVNAVANTFTGPAISIDDFVQESGEAIDILSVDVEGADVDILSGGSAVLRRSVVAVYTEFSLFYRFQSGQKLFGDLCALMERLDFRLAKVLLGPTLELSRRPIGFRSEGIPTGGDCLFLRTPEAIRRDHSDPDVGLAKLAFAALSWGQLDLALSALNLIVDTACLQQRCRTFGRFLADVVRTYSTTPKIYPPLYSEMWSHERSSSRFRQQDNGQDIIAFTRNRARSHVLPRYTAEEFLTGLTANAVQEMETPFEKLLVRNGFEELASEVSKSRRLLIGGLVTALGLMTPDGNLDVAELTTLVGRYCRRPAT